MVLMDISILNKGLIEADSNISNNRIQISLNGIVIDTKDTDPYISNKTDSLMLPVRYIYETLGYNVDWLDERREIRITSSSDNSISNVLIKVDTNNYCIDNDPNIRNTNFEIVNGRSYAPVDFFKDSLNVIIDYHPTYRFVVIDTYGDKSIDKTGKEFDNWNHLLWDKTIMSYLQDDLWTTTNAYDAGHFLMVPLHAAFKSNEEQWQKQFAEHFKRFVNEYYKNNDHIVKSRLDRLQYLYLASQFVVLSEKTI